MSKKNTPYVKKYSEPDKKGKRTLLNPITKEEPYLNYHQTTADKFKNLKGSKNNKKGIRLVVTNLGRGLFMKTKFYTTIFSDKTVVNQVLSFNK